MISLKHLRFLYLAVFIFPSMLAAQPGGSFPSIASFGDSLSDTGNNPPSAGSDYYQGRWCNGPLWVEYLANDWGAQLQNLAFAGSQTSGLSNQVGAIARLGLDLSANLCTIWSGANDFIQNTNNGFNTAAWTTVINSGVENISNAVATLYGMGARNFIVLNVPDLSKTPAGLQSPAAFQSYIQAEIAQFNSKLSNAMVSFRAANPDVQLATVDAFHLMDTLIAKPSTYGFTNVTRDALDALDDPAFGGPATNYLFWDEIHPTTKAHEIVYQSATNAMASLPPGIVIQPASQTVAVGIDAIFYVQAANATSYHWRFNGRQIPGATDFSYQLNPVKAANAGSYSVLVSNAFGSVLSSNAVLRAYVPVSITLQPPSRAVVAGSSATLTVQATGTPPLHYQWKVDGTNIPGAMAAAFAIRRFEAAQAGTYQVVVSNAFGFQDSDLATLSIAVKPTITGQPFGSTIVAGQNVTFVAGAAGTPPLAYQWRLNGRALAGGAKPALQLTNVQPAQAGDYSVKVSNPAGVAISSNAVLTVLVPPRITLQPAGETVAAGKTAQFRVAATGMAPLEYQWRFEGTNLSGATRTILVLTNVQSSQAGSYSVIVSNSVESVISSNAVLTVK